MSSSWHSASAPGQIEELYDSRFPVDLARYAGVYRKTMHWALSVYQCAGSLWKAEEVSAWAQQAPEAQPRAVETALNRTHW